MSTFVMAHGDWSGGRASKKVPSWVIARGHDFSPPAQTGIGERSHLARLIGEQGRARSVAARQAAGLAGQVPPNPMPPDTSEADLAWAVPRRVMQPLATVERPIRLSGAVEQMRRTYVYCTRSGPGDVFGQVAERARTEPGWRHEELDASHNPHITMPETLMVHPGRWARV